MSVAASIEVKIEVTIIWSIELENHNSELFITTKTNIEAELNESLANIATATVLKFVNEGEQENPAKRRKRESPPERPLPLPKAIIRIEEIMDLEIEDGKIEFKEELVISKTKETIDQSAILIGPPEVTKSVNPQGSINAKISSSFPVTKWLRFNFVEI